MTADRKEGGDKTKVRTKRGLSGAIEKVASREKSYSIDLRVHSPNQLGVLTVQGLQRAPALVRLAKTKGIDVIGITDLFSGDFIDEVKEAARTHGNVRVLPGVDLRCAVESCEDLIISCFFPESFGTQEVREFLETFTLVTDKKRGSTTRVTEDLREILARVDARGGFALPSRIDKTPQRLNVVPTLVDAYGFRTFEIAYPEETPSFFKERWPKIKFQLFTFSNASALAQVGCRTAKVKMPEPGFDGLKSILSRIDGGSVAGDMQ